MKKKRKRKKPFWWRVRAYCLRGLLLGILGIAMFSCYAAAQQQLHPSVKKQTNPAQNSDSQKETIKDQIKTWDDSFTVLVNKEHPLNAEYQVNLKKLDNVNVQVAAVIYEDLQQMLSDGSQGGLQFCVASGYRSSERQQEILDADINKLMQKGFSYDDAYKEVTKTVMPAGYSEHETGLALDIVAVSNQRLDDSQSSTLENQWLRENCYRYGFILRYPEGKEDITKIDYESWHFRYVGKEIAKYIMDNGLTLEEYLEINER